MTSYLDVMLSRKEQLTKMFKQFDRDGNGFITLMEASNILQRDPFKFPPSKVLTLLKQFDKDGNGKLDIEEFAGFYAEAKAMSVVIVFTARRYANAVYAMALCLSVNLSVRLSVTYYYANHTAQYKPRGSNT